MRAQYHVEVTYADGSVYEGDPRSGWSAYRLLTELQRKHKYADRWSVRRPDGSTVERVADKGRAS